MKNIIVSLGLVSCIATLAACGSATPDVTPSQEKTSQLVDKTASGQSIDLPYALYVIKENATDPLKKYTLAFTDFDYCNWMENHDPSKLPKNFTLLSVALVNGTATANAAPVPATYTAGAAPTKPGKVVSNKQQTSGFGLSKNCAVDWKAIADGGTVAISEIAGTTATGEINLQLGDGSTLQGSFTTGACVGTWKTAAERPVNDPDLCPTK